MANDKDINPNQKCENCPVRYKNAKLIECPNIFGHYYRHDDNLTDREVADRLLEMRAFTQ